MNETKKDEAKTVKVNIELPPCKRDGHKYVQGQSGASRVLFCEKCADICPLPDDTKPVVGFARPETGPGRPLEKVMGPLPPHLGGPLPRHKEWESIL